MTTGKGKRFKREETMGVLNGLLAELQGDPTAIEVKASSVLFSEPESLLHAWHILFFFFFFKRQTSQ